MPENSKLPRIPYERAMHLFEADGGSVDDSVNVLIHEQPFVVAALANLESPEAIKHFTEAVATYHRAVKHELELAHRERDLEQPSSE